MAKLFGFACSRAEILQRVGDLNQVTGVQVGTLGDGFERGVRTAQFRTGSGFDLTVLVDRGMDLGAASWCGIPLTWRSPAPAIAPAFYEPEGRAWLRGFSGGLMVTGGLTTIGQTGIDEGQSLGLHGRVSYIPATHFAYGGDWNGDEYGMWASGQMREAATLGENLVLRRRIYALMGEPRVFVEDTVTNEGFGITPHMFLYHLNFGFPLLSEKTELIFDSPNVQPRDEDAAMGLNDWHRFQSPTTDFRPQVFYHIPRPDTNGYAQAMVYNRDWSEGKALGVYIRFPVAELPYMAQWKMMGQGTYVCGLEPATNLLGGRAVERAAGRLRFLHPGEICQYHLEIGVQTTL